MTSPTFEMTDRIRDSHRDLSAASLGFLELAHEHPECLDPSSFSHLVENLDDFSKWEKIRLQPWPTFVRASKLAELDRAAQGVCELVKTIPERVFDCDPERLARFYRMQPDHARLATVFWRKKDWLRGLFARPDFIYTDSGFKCLETNLVANLGGWESTYWAQLYLEVPVIARFLQESGVEPRYTWVMRRVMAHLLKESLGRFRQNEVNLVFAMPEVVPMLERFLEISREHFDDLIEKLGLKGTVRLAEVEELEERRGVLYVDGVQVHAVVERFSGPSSDKIYRAWTRGNLLLYNGPFTQVLTDKRNLAVLSELQDAEIFAPEERETIRSAVPWSRRVADDKVHPAAVSPPSKAELIAERERLVLKPGMGLAGQEISVGARTPEGEWREAVDRAFEEGGWIVQERLASPPYLYLDPLDWKPRRHELIWAPFVLGQGGGGWLLRMGPVREEGSGVVNVSQGASTCMVFEVDQ